MFAEILNEKKLLLCTRSRTEEFALAGWLMLNPGAAKFIELEKPETGARIPEKQPVKSVADAKPAPEKKEKPEADNERVALKAELTKLGVAFSGRQNTAYLKTLLAKAKETNTAPPAPPAGTAGTAAAPEKPKIPEQSHLDFMDDEPEATPVTRDEVQNALKTYAKTFKDKLEGRNNAVKLLTETANVEQLGLIPDEKLGILMEKLKHATAA